MTLFEVEELCRYWADYPPVHVTLAALSGRRRHSAGAAPEQSVERIAAGLGPGFARGNIDAGLPPVVLSFEQLRVTAAAVPGSR